MLYIDLSCLRGKAIALLTPSILSSALVASLNTVKARLEPVLKVMAA